MKIERSPLSTFLVTAPLALLVVTAPIFALAQAPTDPFGQVSRNPVIISQQISMALQFERRALDLLASADASPENADTIKSLVAESYRLVRTAHAGARNRQEASRNQFLNPLWQIEDDLMEQARGALLQCMSALDHIRAGASQDVGEATDWLTRAIAHLQTLQAVLP